MATSASADFEFAVDLLAGVAYTLSKPEATAGNPKEVAVLVE
jgi:hypothetical protein